jgi:hypothetical protein
LPEIATRFGIDPTVWIPVFCLAMNTFLLSYTNVFALTAEKSMGDAGWNPKHLTWYGLVYCAVSVASVCLTIPYWRAIGLIG